MEQHTSFGKGNKDQLLYPEINTDERYQNNYDSSSNKKNLNHPVSFPESSEPNYYEPFDFKQVRRENKNQIKFSFLNYKVFTISCVFFFVFGACAAYMVLCLTNQLHDKFNLVNADIPEHEKTMCENSTTHGTTVAETTVSNWETTQNHGTNVVDVEIPICSCNCETSCTNQNNGTTVADEIIPECNCQKSEESLTSIVQESTTLVNNCDTPKPQADCPAGFTLNEQAGKCYKLIHFKATHAEQTANCASLAPGAHLAAPLSAAENNFIDGLILTSTVLIEQRNCRHQPAEGGSYHNVYYLGGRNINKETCSEFVWEISDDLLQKMRYRNFIPGEPNCHNKNELCIHTSKDLKWNDNVCSLSACALCELKLN